MGPLLFALLFIAETV